MRWMKRLSVIALGFGVGFAAMAIWYYLYWASLESAVLTGVLVAILSGVVWATPDSFPRTIRRIAALTLIGILLIYGLYIYSILSVSDCSIIDGRLRCMNRNF